jgi:hypothetical protein
MDKEWPLGLVGFVGLGVVGMLIAKKWPVISIFILLLIALCSARQIGELNDPYVGPAIKTEAGIAYVLLS